MKIFDETKTYKLNYENLDLEKGYLKPDKLFVKHHDKVEAKQAIYNRRVEKLSNGSTQVWQDLVSPVVPAKEAYDEYEDIQVYVPYTEAELKERVNKARSTELKAELAKIKEDIEQETFGLVRDDYTEKKARAAEIVNELRVLEGKEPREIDYKL